VAFQTLFPRTGWEKFKFRAVWNDSLILTLIKENLVNTDHVQYKIRLNAMTSFITVVELVDI